MPMTFKVIVASLWNMKFYVFVFACVVGLSAVSCQGNREFLARRAARECAREQKVSYEVAYKFSRGDFSDDSLPAKCFLKCLAYKLKFFNKDGVFQKEELLIYTKYLVPESIPSRKIFDECQVKVVRADDECEYVYQGYKCFWDGVKRWQELNRDLSVRFSLYDLLHFERLEAEEKEVEANLSE